MEDESLTKLAGMRNPQRKIEPQRELDVKMWKKKNRPMLSIKERKAPKSDVQVELAKTKRSGKKFLKSLKRIPKKGGSERKGGEKIWYL